MCVNLLVLRVVAVDVGGPVSAEDDPRRAASVHGSQVPQQPLPLSRTRREVNLGKKKEGHHTHTHNWSNKRERESKTTHVHRVRERNTKRTNEKRILVVIVDSRERGTKMSRGMKKK